MASFNAAVRLRAILPLSKLTIRLAAFLLAMCASLQAQTPAVHFSGVQSSFPNPATYPYGLAVDKVGNIFVADNDYDGAYVVPFSNGTYNGSGNLGTFQQPWGIAVDGSDNVYIVENGANDVIKETPTPTPYGTTWTESVLPTSGLESPQGIAVDNAGNVYIADVGHQRIVKETPQGNTYTQSIVPTSPQSSESIAVDGSGSVYSLDSLHLRVLKETPSGTGYTESTVVDNLPWDAWEVAVDGSGNVFILVSDLASDYGVLKETPSAGGYVQSTVALAGYQNPYGIAADASGNVYLDSPGSGRLLKLAPFAGNIGMVNTGSTGSPVSLIFVFDSGGTIGAPEVRTQGATGLDFIDAGTGSCTTQGPGHLYSAGDSCSIDIAFQPQFPGDRKGAGGLQDTAGNPLAGGYLYGTGVGPQAAFPPGRQVGLDIGLVRPLGVTVDGGGNVFFAAIGSGAIYKETLSGDSELRTQVAGGLNHPTAVAVDGAGNLYVAAADGLYQETPLAGGYQQKVLIGSLAKLAGVAVDGSGNLYITSSASGNVHKETLAANGGYTESAVGFGITSPGGVAVDGRGNVFVTDFLQGEVYRETLEADGTYRQTTVAGGLAGPQSVALDGGGNLYITGSLSGVVYKETPDGNGGYVQSIAYAGLDAPWGIGVDGRGTLYLSLDTPNGELAMIDVADPPPVLNFVKTPVGDTSTDSPQLVTLANIGNAALTMPMLSSGANPSITAGFTLGPATTCPVLGSTGADGSVAAGSTCVYAIDFTPVAAGPVRGALVLADTSLNRYYPNFAVQRIELREGITSDATRTTLRVNPDQIKKGLGVTMTATVVDTSVLSIVPQGSVTFTDKVGGKAVVLNGGVPVPLSGGKAVLTMIPKVAGQHAITVHYGGVNASFAGSTGEAALTVYP